MNKPKCRVCGVAHWASEPHEFPVRQSSNRPNAQLDKNSNKPARLDKNSNSLITELRARIAELEQQVVDLQQPFDKTAYQREYMRKRRMAATGE